MTQQSAAVQLTGSPHVLIVDDEEGIRELMSDNLSELGYTCHTASCGDDALALLSKQEVQVALLDVMMPGMTGLSLFQHLQERFPNIAVVFVTAVDDLSLAVEHLKSGAYDYVVKPVTRRRLHQVVGDALARREAGLEQQRLRALIEEQADRNARDLEAKARELSTLNRVFQEELNRKYTGEGSALESETESETTHGRRATLSLHEALKKRVSEYLTATYSPSFWPSSSGLASARSSSRPIPPRRPGCFRTSRWTSRAFRRTTSGGPATSYIRPSSCWVWHLP